MSVLERWAERYLKEVSQDGECTTRVRLATTDGSTWATWDAPFGTPKEWAEGAEATLVELAIEWPSQAIQVLFIAEDNKFAARGQLAKTVRGQNKQATTFSGQGKALTDGMSALSATLGKILDTANVQLDSCTKTIEAQQSALHEAYTYIRLINERDATRLPSPTKEAAAQLMEQVGENLPVILELMKGLKLRKPGSAAAVQAAVRSAGTGAVHGALNGALAGLGSGE